MRVFFISLSYFALVTITIVCSEQTDVRKNKGHNSYVTAATHNTVRTNFNLEDVSSNLADYDIIECEKEGKDKECGLVDFNETIEKIRSTDNHENSPESYLQSLFMYSIINILTLIILVFTCIVYSIISCCCCCCGKNKQQPKLFLGYEWTSKLAFLFTILTILFAIVLIVMGMELGASSLTAWVADSPESYASHALVVQTEVRAMALFLIGLCNASRSFFLNTNVTLFKAINFSRTENDLDHIKDILLVLENTTNNTLEEVDHLDSLFDNTEKTLKNLIDDLLHRADLFDKLASQYEYLSLALNNGTSTSDLNETCNAAQQNIKLVNFDASLSFVTKTNENIDSFEDSITEIKEHLNDTINSLDSSKEPVFSLIVLTTEDISKYLVDLTEMSNFQPRKIYEDYVDNLDSSEVTIEKLQDDLSEGLKSLDGFNATNLSASIVKFNDSFFEAIKLSKLDEYQDSLDSPSYPANINVIEYQIRFSTTSDSLKEIAVEFKSISTEVDNINNELNGVELADTEELTKLQDVLGENIDRLDDYKFVLLQLKEFLTNQLSSLGFHKNIASLEYNHLKVLLSEKGFGYIYLEVLGSLDNMINYFVNMTNYTSTIDNLKTSDLVEENEDTAALLNRAHATVSPYDSIINEGGYLHYLMNIANKTREKIVLLEDSTADTIEKDKNGDRYEDDKYCVTNDCFTNSETEYTEYEVAPGLTITTVAFLFYIPFLILLVVCIALLVLFGTSSVYTKSCNSCFWLTILMLLPLYLIVTAIFFPFVMAFSDTCESYEDVAYLYASSYGDSLCLKLGGEGTFRECIFDIDTLTVKVHLQDLVRSLLGHVDADKCSSMKPIDNIISEIVKQLPSYFIEKAREISDDVHLAPNMTENIIAFSNDTTVEFTKLLQATNDNLNCDVVTNFFSSTIEPICNYMVGSLTWFIVTIYLLIWVFSCLGLPSSYFISQKIKYDNFENISKETRRANMANMEILEDEVRQERIECELMQMEDKPDFQNRYKSTVQISDDDQSLSQGPKQNVVSSSKIVPMEENENNLNKFDIPVTKYEEPKSTEDELIDLLL